MYDYDKDNTPDEAQLQQTQGSSWPLWALWVLTYALGYPVGGYLGATAAGQVLKLFPSEQRGLENGWATLASGLVWAAVLGFILSGFQALLLHYYLRDFDWRRWVFASVLGLTSAVGLVAATQGLVAEQASNMAYFTIYLSVLVGIAGGVFGWAQHLVLAVYLADENGWILATCLASAISTLLAMLWFLGRVGSSTYFDIDFFWLGGAIFLGTGLATGFVLRTLARSGQIA